MQINMHLNINNPSILNGACASGNAGKNRAEGLARILLNAENKPLTAQLNKARAAFLASMLYTEAEPGKKKGIPVKVTSPVPFTPATETAPASHKRAGNETGNQCVDSKKVIANQTSANIDDFIKNLNEIKFSNQNILGKGSYGTVYRFGDFVVKTPVNCHGIQVDWMSGAQKSANPERVSRYLNLANDDESFSRVANINFKGKEIKVLVSKYIEGVQLEPEEIDDAEDLLHERGFHMHDINVDGNVLKTKDDKYYFIDADQLVVFSPVLGERRPSETTIELEEGLTSMLAFKHHQATMKHETDELEILKYEIEAFENATGRTVQKRA